MKSQRIPCKHNTVSRRIAVIGRRLTDEYGERELPPGKPPLDELIFTILSQHTSDTNRDRAWARLRRDGLPWSRISELPAGEIEERIRPGGLAAQKAKAILTILGAIKTDRGSVDLEFLKEMDDEEANRFLLGLKGVGPKTAACVLLFSLGRPAFPVDTHVHRLAIRLGLIAENTQPARAHQVLKEMIPSDMYLSLHLNLISHGRKICRARNPLCGRCILSDICPWPR